MCRRRLAIGTLLGLTRWVYGLILAATVLSFSQLASALLLLYLVWTPVEALRTGDLRRRNKGI